MNRSLNSLLTLLLAGAVAASAQGPRGPQQPRSSGINISALQVIQGVVTAVDVAYGAQYPTIVVNQTQIKMAPAWYLLDNDIEIKTGDTVKVTAAPALNPEDKYVYAVDITKGTAYLKLRDADGSPLWASNRGQQRGDGKGECDGCLDAASITTVSGVVDKVTAGLGIQFPTLVLKTADGKLLSIRVGPEKVLLAGDFEITAGQKLTVKYAASTCKDELVALEIANDSGKKIVLRNADGSPAWR